MEEKILIKSEQYNAKRILKTLLIIGIISTIIAFLCCYISVNAAYNSNSWMQERYASAFTCVIQEWAIQIFLVPVGFGIVSLIIYFWLRSFGLTITDKRIYGNAAFGKRVDLPLDSVSAVGTSALKGIAVGTSSGKIKFKLIKNQKEIHEVISKLLAERQRREKTPVETTVNQTIVETSNADELKKFKELLDMGAITQEEFDAKKKELLGL